MNQIRFNNITAGNVLSTSKQYSISLAQNHDLIPNEELLRNLFVCEPLDYAKV